MDRTAISDQIDRILRSQSFASKDQLRKLLDVLFKNMDAQTTLKPDRVIKELWPDEIRTKRSADVATEMNRLRHALESYYDGQGRADPIIISLPNRSGVGPDGLQETRWIAAEPRGALESASALLAPLANRRRDLKIVVATVAACVAAYFLIRLVTADNRPHSGRMDGAALTIVNAEGKELWAKSFPEGFWREYYEPGLAPRIRFADLDGSGHTDVLFLYHPAVSPTSRTTTLICYSDRGKEKWRWTPGRDLPELQGTPSNYRTYGLEFLEGAEGKGARRIVVASGHTLYYPYQIAILNSNGKTISEYWHSGGLNHFVVANLNGKPEIFAAGVSNGYRQATLVVLDPDKVYGASTELARPEIQLHGFGTAKERIRLLFPRSDLGTAVSPYNYAGEAVVANGRIRVPVQECLYQQAGCEIGYEFDSNFHLLSVEIYDQFRSAHNEFYMRTRSDHLLTPQEEAEFQKVRCLVGCTAEFVTYEAKPAP